MAESIFETLTVFFSQYGLWVIFFGVMLENAGMPVPGETVLLFAGFLAYRGEVHLWRAMITGIVAASIGDSLGYLLGRYAGDWFIRLVRRFRFLSRHFDRAQTEFQKHGHWAVFIGRFITGLRVFAGPLAGMFRMPYGRFIFFNFTGATVWGITIISVGFLFGGSWDSLVEFVEKFHQLSLIGFVVIVLAGAGYYFLRRRKRQGSPGNQP
ncbi:MAG TPA: DedA family protein [Terriglobia bacterium]|nr:DedA family protein [Terriglobia bacterium]